MPMMAGPFLIRAAGRPVVWAYPAMGSKNAANAATAANIDFFMFFSSMKKVKIYVHTERHPASVPLLFLCEKILNYAIFFRNDFEDFLKKESSHQNFGFIYDYFLPPPILYIRIYGVIKSFYPKRGSNSHRIAPTRT